MPLKNLLLMTLFFLSGLTGLVYQVIWSQQFSLIFGSTEVAVAAVLAAYMGGLALGAYLMGRLIHRVKRPVIWYALFELLLAIIALSMSGLIDAGGHVFTWFIGTQEMTSVNQLHAPIYVLGAFAVLIIPTALMGATLPLLSKYVITSDRTVGSGIGFLYATNTLGACLGALLAAFWLIPDFGLQHSIYVAVGINVFIFFLGIVFFQTQSSESPDSTRPFNIELQHRWMLGIMFVSGVVSFSHEVMWTRLLSHLLGGSVYAFGVMLFMFLLGIGLGAIIGFKLTQANNKMLGFTCLQVGIAAMFFISFTFADQLTALPINQDFGSLVFVFSAMLLGALTLLPGALLIGATFPLATQICTRNFKQAPAISARIYAWNTTGAICGALLCGFVLLSQFGFADTARILTILSLFAGCFVAYKSHQSGITKAILGLLIVLLAVLPIQEPLRVLSHSPLGVKQQTADIDFLAVGQSATVIMLNKNNEKRLLTNGLPESSVQAPGDRISKYHLAWWLSKLPVMSRPQTQDALIIGLGAGLTLQAVPHTVRRVDVVELEEEVIHANQSVASWRREDPLADPRLHLHHNDARNALRNSQQQFDVVISQPSHPWTAGASNLYTREFFALVESRLNQSGVFVQWIGLRYVDQHLLRSLLATLNAEFRHVELYQPLSQGGLLFMASNEPLNISEDTFNRSQDLSEWRLLGVNSWLELMLSRRLNASQSRSFSDGAELSTDQHNVMKIRSPKVISRSLPKTEFDRLFADDDWRLDDFEPSQTLSAVNRLIKEGQMIRLNAMIERMQNSELKQLSMSMMQYVFVDKQQAKATLLNSLSSSNHALTAGQFLMAKEPVLSLRNPTLVALIETDQLTSLVLENWRLLRLQKWTAVKPHDEQLGQIPADHVLYDMAKILRINWRLQSREHDYLQQALAFTDELLSARQSLHLLETRAKLALELENQEVLVAVMYDFKRIANQSGPLNSSAQKTLRALLERLKYMQNNGSNFALESLRRLNQSFRSS
ncbi:fused MFS/spermidine synthase [Marinicella sediminis]|uniref:Fused MFS/spermidine synthase n=1 Tax=Marinicella sediminis TaxID=1792834 RepID=A0ABV7JCI4_9GAMM|nr:fused MFS/spermidine synthase [Marinicella sediminis]